MTTQSTLDRQVTRFEKLAARVEEVFKKSTDRSGEALEAALTEARRKLEAAEELAPEEGETLERWLRRDLQLLSKSARSATRSTKERLQVGLDPSRIGSAFLGLGATVLESTSQTLQAWAAKADEATSYRTGEVTGPGTLECRRCGTELRMGASSKIPPCPKCRATEFSKSY